MYYLFYLLFVTLDAIELPVVLKFLMNWALAGTDFYLYSLYFVCLKLSLRNTFLPEPVLP